MRNPFKAIGGAITGAGKAISGAITGAGKAIASTTTRASQAVARTVTRPFQRQERAAKPAAPKTPQSKAPVKETTTKTPPTTQFKAPVKETTTKTSPAAQTSTPPAQAPSSGGKRLPRSMFPANGGRKGISPDYGRDERILGTDSDAERSLTEAIKDFEADHKISILGDSAKGFIDNPTFSSIFDKYSTGSGWSSDQWFKGANDIRDIQISKKPGGKIEITFDADFVIDGDVDGSGDIGVRTVNVVF